ncbi:hypothetical protein [Nocardia transvalensis]|uniref:hypothetical protein n=1 Tax=Nocardia transvalensis TaxID=37333 RepID=UPI001894B147|nr:hypothetical protein [Nocardia transvalensis]MBF6333005.1 hypothetical protein [Nocardia transvalensis]
MSPFVFGIYPGGTSAAEPVRPDDPARIGAALIRLQGETGRPLRIRCYTEYLGDGTEAIGRIVPADVEPCLRDGRRMDLVALFQSPDVDGFQRFVQRLVQRYGPWLDTIQVTEEADIVGCGMDGDTPNVYDALVAGALTAKDQAARQGLDIRVGFSVADPDEDFFGSIDAAGAIDYVGLDAFPGVWDDEAPDSITDSLQWLRGTGLPAAGLGAEIPIIVTEHGWATSPGRSADEQAAVLERVVRTVHAHRADLNIAGYTWFTLRDADSTSPDPFDRFGILHDDYTPKPAFEVYRRLIAELSA